MFPYIEHPTFQLGPISLHAFGLLVGTAVLVGSWLVLGRSNRKGLDPDRTSLLLLWMLGIAFLGSHLEHLAFLRPSPLLRPSTFLDNPLLWLNLWDGMSSFGGIIGGVLGAVWYMKRSRWSRGEIWTFLDVVAFSFPFAWSIARFGCYLAHDHPGIPTTSWLAVRYPSGPRYDLGLIDFFFSVILSGFFLALDRRSRPSGFYLATFMLLYGPARLLLDNLRVEERFAGLTAGQFGAVAALCVGIVAFRKVLRETAHPGRA